MKRSTRTRNTRLQHEIIMKKKNIPKNIDLLIVDIDDTFLYHRTVANANMIFLEEVCRLFNAKAEREILGTWQTLGKILYLKITRLHRLRLKKDVVFRILFLLKTAFVLYPLDAARVLLDRVRIKNNINSRMITRWAEAVKKLGIKGSEYGFSKETVKKALYPIVLGIYQTIRNSNPKMKTAAISMGFKARGKKEPLQELLKLDYYFSNEFLCGKNGRITGYKINIKNGQDKKRIAEKLVKRLKAKRIAVIIEDYEDLKLLELKNVAEVMYSRKIGKFIGKKVFKSAIDL